MALVGADLLNVRLAADTSIIAKMTDDLAQLLAKAPDAFREKLLRVVDGGTNLFCIGADGAAASGTGELTVTLQPSEFMNALVATARAGDFDMSVFDHVLSSDGCLSSAIEDRPPVESQDQTGGQPNASSPEVSDDR